MPHWGRIKTAHARQPSTGERYGGRREQTGQPHKQQQQQQRQEQEEKETGSSVMITERGQQKKNCSRFAKRK